MKCLHSAFAIAVLCLAVFQFSENTADPDLWSHVFFGTQFIHTGKPTTVDYYSWTAYGQPSFDHEYLGEAVFGLAYLCLGGSGLLLLKLFVGLLTFGIALSMNGRDSALRCHRPYSGRNPPQAEGAYPHTMLVAWAFGALAVVEISFGFAARPQIFTALSLAIELWLLRCIHSGNWRWALALPPLFALWFNLHGGALAGLVLLFAAAAATSAQIILTMGRGTVAQVSKPAVSPISKSAVIRPQTAGRFEYLRRSGLGNLRYVPPRTAFALWIAAIISAGTVVLNPHGLELARWLVGSVLWLRPQIQEWNPTTLGWDHAAFFFCAAFAAAAFVASRRERQLWEAAVLAVLFIVGFRAVRNAPLFCIAALALVPPHLADVLQRHRASYQRFEELFSLKGVQRILTVVLALISAGILWATGTLHKEHFWTMEIPRSQYPVAAIQFIRQHDLHGNLVAFFDWGEMCIWDLPESPVSIDGRLDSVYSPAVIDTHWKLYNGEPFDTNVLNLARADFALLPSNLVGAKMLVTNDKWQAAYYDNCAVVLVKNPAQFPKLTGMTLPVQGPATATEGRAPFPNRMIN